MLYTVKDSNRTLHKSCALLFFISCITFHTTVSADIKSKAAENYRVAGYEEQQKGNLNDALLNYTKAVSLGIDNAVLYNDMGVLYEEIDLIGKAELHYLKAIASDKHYLPPYMNLAYLYQRVGKKDKAITYFKKRYELGDPLEKWAQKAKDELLTISPEYYDWVQSREADALDKQLVAKSHEEFYHRVQKSQEGYERGKKLTKNGKHKAALDEYEAALRYTPGNPQIKEARNMAILEIAKQTVKEQSEYAIKRLETGDTVSARHEIQKILTTIPNEPILISR